MTREEFKLKALPLKNKLFRVAKRLLNDSEGAEDATQDVYMKLWEKRDVLDNYENIEAFAVTVTKNHCIDLLRKKKVKFIEMNEDYVNPVMNNPEKIYENNEFIDNIKALIEKLPDKQKSVIHLKDIEGFSMTEIAEILDTTEGNIRVLLSRARNQIRKFLIKKIN